MTRKSFKQSGAALIVSLLMLLVLTILVITTVNTSKVDSRIAYNAQTQQEAEAAANQVIQVLLSDYRCFTRWGSDIDLTPAAGVRPCGAGNPAWSPLTSPSYIQDTIPMNKGSYTVKIYRPICVGYFDTGEGGDCPATSQGIILDCKSAHWDVKVESIDTNTGAKAVFHQGVKVNVSRISPFYDGYTLDQNLQTYCSS